MKTCLDICKKCVREWEERKNVQSFEGWTDLDDHHWNKDSYVFCPPQLEVPNVSGIEETSYPPNWCKYMTESVMLKEASDHPEKAKRKKPL